VIKFSYKITTLVNILLLDVKFEKFTIRLYFLLISFIFVKFLES